MIKGKEELVSDLKNKKKIVVMLAPSFIVMFDYPNIINQLKKLGADKVVEVTFGAKMVNREYHEQLLSLKKEVGKKECNFLISSACAGIQEFIRNKHKGYLGNLAKIDSPMIAMAKICKKFYPKHKIAFISPCNFKKLEAARTNCIDYVVNYQELRKIFDENKIEKDSRKTKFDKFYNEYTRVYPVSGGLSRTAHLKGILKKGEEKIIDGIVEVDKFLKKPDKNIRFLDINFCKGACIGGIFVSSNLNIEKRKKKVLKYIELAKRESIPGGREGVVKEAEGIRFNWD